MVFIHVLPVLDNLQTWWCWCCVEPLFTLMHILYIRHMKTYCYRCPLWYFPNFFFLFVLPSLQGSCVSLLCHLSSISKETVFTKMCVDPGCRLNRNSRICSGYISAGGVGCSSGASGTKHQHGTGSRSHPCTQRAACGAPYVSIATVWHRSACLSSPHVVGVREVLALQDRCDSHTFGVRGLHNTYT